MAGLWVARQALTSSPTITGHDGMMSNVAGAPPRARKPSSSQPRKSGMRRGEKIVGIQPSASSAVRGTFFGPIAAREIGRAARPCRMERSGFARARAARPPDGVWEDSPPESQGLLPPQDPPADAAEFA